MLRAFYLSIKQSKEIGIFPVPGYAVPLQRNGIRTPGGVPFGKEGGRVERPQYLPFGNHLIL